MSSSPIPRSSSLWWIPTMLGRTRRSPPAWPRCTGRDPAALPFDDSSFAGVVYLWPMENLDHTALVVGELLRVLEPDGVLFAVGSADDEVLEHADIAVDARARCPTS